MRDAILHIAEIHPARARGALMCPAAAAHWGAGFVGATTFLPPVRGLSPEGAYRAMAAALRQEGVDLAQDWFDARTGLSSAEMIRTLLDERGLSWAAPSRKSSRHRTRCSSSRRTPYARTRPSWPWWRR
ncbi:hypothetical protein [Streptomyces aureoversilis]|uniref:Uncharacterized protein n=1 Tax=Streptomyces aureoversilis TaxID=67277 RepID=A0ABW0A3J1_9ACTN